MASAQVQAGPAHLGDLLKPWNALCIAGEDFVWRKALFSSGRQGLLAGFCLLRERFLLTQGTAVLPGRGDCYNIAVVFSVI